MDTTLFLEAFGRLAPGTTVIDVADEDLHSVFRARSELLSWAPADTPHPRFWHMHEAELIAGEGPGPLGWVQVGVGGEEMVPGSEAWPPILPTDIVPSRRGLVFMALPHHRRYPADPVGSLPALSQCFLDALRRFGEITLSGLQVTITNLVPHTRTDLDLFATHNWFNLAAPTRTTAHVALDQALLGDHTAAVLADYLQEWNTGSFTFGPVVTVPAPHRVHVPLRDPLPPAATGVMVTLPEWTASAVGWVMAFVVDHARALTPEIRDCAVRVTRVGNIPAGR